MTTPVITKQITGRRTLRFESYEQILQDAERIAGGPHEVLGNWSAGQVFRHLATVMKGAIDGMPFQAPWFIRLPARLLKKVFLRRPMPAGFKLPRAAATHLVPPETATEEGLLLLRQAIHRLQTETTRAPSPVFGPMTRAEWDQLQFRHCELHLSFLIPASL